MTDALERVACYDAIVDAGSSEPEDARDEKDSTDFFGRKDAQARRILEQKLALQRSDMIEATAQQVSRSAYSKLIVQLDNGQIWRQLDSAPLRLVKGDVIVIRKARFGSFLLAKKTGSTSIRVKRLE